MMWKFDQTCTIFEGEVMNMDNKAQVSEEGNLVKVLVLFASWRRCSTCGASVLFVDATCGSEGPFVCGACYGRAATLPANDNGDFLQ
jgi:hypothetical protein